MVNRRKLYTGLWGTLFILALTSIFIGSMELSLPQLIQLDQVAWMLLVTSRLPRLVSVVITGVGLSVAGLLMQQLSQNRFVSPSTAATQDSARLGILVSMIFFSSSTMYVRVGFAFMFALLGTGLFITAIEKIRIKNMIFVPLLGMTLGMVIDSLTTFLALRFDVMQALSAYMVGNFSLLIRGRYELLYLAIIVVGLGYVFSHRFSVASMGEAVAVNLGLNYRQTIQLGLLIVSLISAVIVVTVGSIAYVGLIVPNIISMTFGDNLKRTLPTTALVGANFLLLADILSRVVIYPYQVPVGLIVGVVGSLLFIVILVQKRKLA
ncbi:MAG TPA: iron ABC transporter permease [Erysipelotrichaceae bacterium]|nr:iron ABC transporter permease [Erysipelotrichaceae bacterium]